MNRGKNIDEILEYFKAQGAIDVKCTEGTRGLHIDFKTAVDDIWQYTFIRFDE